MIISGWVIRVHFVLLSFLKLPFLVIMHPPPQNPLLLSMALRLTKYCEIVISSLRTVYRRMSSNVIDVVPYFKAIWIQIFQLFGLQHSLKSKNVDDIPGIQYCLHSNIYRCYVRKHALYKTDKIAPNERPIKSVIGKRNYICKSLLHPSMWLQNPK